MKNMILAGVVVAMCLNVATAKRTIQAAVRSAMSFTFAYEPGVNDEGGTVLR